MPELIIKYHVRWRRLQYILFFIWIGVSAGLFYSFYNSLTDRHDIALLQALIFFIISLQVVYRARYLKALFVRVNDAEIRWRLIAELEIRQRLRPPISEATLAWNSITRVRNMATGMYFTVRGEEKECYLPLSNFSYAQRQEIKHAIAARLGDLAIEDQVHTYVQHEPAHPDAAENEVPNEDASSAKENTMQSAVTSAYDDQKGATPARSGG